MVPTDARSTAARPEIRPLEPDDHDVWLRLWRGYLTFYEVDLPEEVTAVLWDRIQHPDAEPRGLAAVVDGQVVGIVHVQRQRSTWLVEDQLYLEDLFVDPTHRGAGVGRALIEAVYAAAAAEDLRQVYWLTQEFNTTARLLYDRVATVTPFIRYQHTLPRTPPEVS